MPSPLASLETAMYTGKTIFAQLTSHLPIRRFHTLVKRYDGEYKVRAFSCLDHLLTMLFAQLASCDSLRDIEACLSANPSKLYHLGIRSRIRRSTLADANENRDARIFEDFAKILVGEARKLYATEKPFPEIDSAIYAFDSTTISLCLELFPWAEFRRKKAGIKLHTLIDIKGNIPSFVLLSQAKMHDVKALDHLPVEAGCIYLVDRGYIDFTRLFRIHQAGAFFVTRLKDNTRYRVVKSQPVDKTIGVLCDQIICLTGSKAAIAYPERLRRVKYRDVETGMAYEFLTNNFTLPALVIAKLYKQRWRVELFFKWIKQHLRIKTFFGVSENAVRIQVWTALSAYLLLAIVRKRLSLPHELHEMTQTLRLHLFEKMPILSMFFEQPPQNNTPRHDNQLALFE
jgi:hypothetical protein